MPRMPAKNPVPRYECYRIPLNRGGYDRHGRYYGVGAPVYEVWGVWERLSPSGEVAYWDTRIRHYRAYSKAEARAKHFKDYPSDLAEIPKPAT